MHSAASGTGKRVGTRPAVALLVSAAALALAGCEKPTPGVSVWSGTKSVNSEAACWNEDPARVGAKDCLKDLQNLATSGATLANLPIRANGTLGISVDPELAADGWSASIAGQQLTTTPVTETYFRISLPSQLPQQEFLLTVAANAPKGGNRGVWLFKLTPNS